MHFYRELNVGDDPVTVYQHTATLAEAHASLKVYGEPLRPDLRVELVEIATDKASLVNVLNGVIEVELLRTWKLTPRGGLLEITNGE